MPRRSTGIHRLLQTAARYELGAETISPPEGKPAVARAPIILLLGLVLAAPALAQPRSCRPAPDPVLQLRIPATPTPIVHSVSATEIEQISGPKPPHALMAMADALDVQIKIVDVYDPNSSDQCPQAQVTATFGIGRRDVFLVNEAAGSSCIRDALLGHERHHYRIVSRAAQAFLDQHRSNLERVARAWQASDTTTREALQAALLGVLKSLSDEFAKSVRGTLRDEADIPSALSELDHACDNAVGLLDRTIREAH